MRDSEQREVGVDVAPQPVEVDLDPGHALALGVDLGLRLDLLGHEHAHSRRETRVAVEPFLVAEQLLRYQERLDRDARFAPTVGYLVAQQIKPQAKVFAESKGVTCVEVDLDALRGDIDDLTLF